MTEHNKSSEPRTRYYVSVQAGQMLEDQHAAPYELVIDATEEEAAQLHSLFKQYASSDDVASFHFTYSFFETSDDTIMNGHTDHLLQKIYTLIHDCGTEETRRHVEEMNILQ